MSFVGCGRFGYQVWVPGMGADVIVLCCGRYGVGSQAFSGSASQEEVSHGGRRVFSGGSIG